MAAEITRESVADILIRRSDIDPDAVTKAREAANTSGTRLELVLFNQKLVNDIQMALAISEYLDIPAISLEHFSPEAELIKRLSPHLTAEHSVMPLAQWDSCFAVAMADPFDVMLMEELQDVLGGKIIPYVAPQSEVRKLLEGFESESGGRLKDALRDVNDANAEIQVASDDEDMGVEDMMSMQDDVPVVRIVNSMLIEALHRGASDIHVEPMESGLQVRYRVDGVLYDELSPPKYMQWAIISRLKIISNLDIAERRLPQDGRFTIRAPGRDVDVRVSMIPTVHGQKAVLRILDKLNLKPNIAALGLEPDDHAKVMRAIHRTSGLFLVTGPTGSGKTTTLYSALQELNDPGVNIITVEDPVEYQLPRINQIHARPSIGLTFASGLKSILRQDPDIIMVGEIRDGETASIAIQAALTGHLVLSTLHTNDAASAVARLIHMGVEPFLISSALVASQAQRIYRRLCRACRKRREIPWDVLSLHSIDSDLFRDAKLFAAKGCLRCGHIGYSGRESVMEILEVDEDIKELILREVSAAKLRDMAVSKGMLTLRDAGLQRVLKGITSVEEMLRVTGS